MWRMFRGLYLGDHAAAENRRLLLRRRVTHILNCAVEIPCWFPDDFTYFHLGMTDPDPSFAACIPDICSFIRKGRGEGRVLVHCAAGMSRSPAAILAYLCRRGMTVRGAYTFIEERLALAGDHYIDPAQSFLDQLEEYFG